MASKAAHAKTHCDPETLKRVASMPPLAPPTLFGVANSHTRRAATPGASAATPGLADSTEDEDEDEEEGEVEEDGSHAVDTDTSSINGAGSADSADEVLSRPFPIT